MSNQKTNQISKETMTAAWAIALGAIAPMLDSTMINIAIKQLNQTFNTTLDTVQWGITGYILALAMIIPVAGWLINQFNGKRVFIGASFLFGLTSVLAGISWNVDSFIIFRIIQGLSAGVITTLMFTLLIKTTGQEHIGKVMAVVSTPMIFGPILGPVLGGFIVHFASWRWMFFINIVVVIIAVALQMKYLPDFKPFNKAKSMDVIGIILLALISLVFIYGLTKAADYHSFFNSVTLIYIIIGVVLMIGYYFYNRHKNNDTILPLSIFRKRNYSASFVGLFLSNIGIMGPMVIIPLYFQTFKHYTAIEAALALIPQGLGMLITRPYIGKAIDKYGAKWVVIISVIIAMFGSVPLLFITQHTSIIWLSVILFIRGCSVGGINLGMTTDAYMGLGEDEIAEAGVGINMIENVGASFGTAFIATTLAMVLNRLGNSVTHSITAYHAGFLVSVVTLLIIIIPALFLTHKNQPTA
ncbi:MDR family MFS transporter [Staphylococcus petrasii]|uniref:MDR family MFS transporter n=1 Tax=Staphylococcus petrasii TaxID=1276936 RepID=UPI000CD1B06C|nr:MDR family MFS transporter [Staphylococcus petrasii]PNZ80551.1 MFS transporter [Staphylococcus petrasii]TGA83013.1 DHA2 family efflux MFS transporter permease subunit [Staphylococcus petrasii]SUM59788.1 Multidrug resistance protein B [Staphylococcus petrasii]